MRTFTRVAIFRRPTWGQLLCNAGKLLSQFDLPSLKTASAAEVAEWEAGTDMERLGVSSCIRVPMSHEQVVSRIRDSWYAWARKMFSPMLDFKPCIDVSKLMSYFPDESSDFSSNPLHTYFYALQARRVYITLENKDPSVLWVRYLPALAWRWRKQLQDASSTWALVEGNTASATKLLQLMYDASLPMKIQRQQGYRTSISEKVLPYTFPAVKRKCWESKDGHIHHVCDVLSWPQLLQKHCFVWEASWKVEV